MSEFVIRRPAGEGWLALVGGGEFSFGETVEMDRAWLAHAGEGAVGFIPAASASSDYGRHFASYLAEGFDRPVEVIPIYRLRDARRAKNLRRIEEAAALYLGAGLAEQLLDAVSDSPANEAMLAKLRAGGVVVAIGAAAHALGQVTRSLRGDDTLPGLGWLQGGVVETNFSTAHDRRLRRLLEAPGVTWGLGLPPGSALLLGPEGAIETVGMSFLLEDAEADFKVLTDSVER